MWTCLLGGGLLSPGLCFHHFPNTQGYRALSHNMLFWLPTLTHWSPLLSLLLGQLKTNPSIWFS